MKKLITYLFIIMMSISLYGQKKLYKEFKSGMLRSEFYTYVVNNPEFEFYPSRETFRTTISNRVYIATPFFNKEDKLSSLGFYAIDHYDWMEYDVNIKRIASELYTVLSVSYGRPIYNNFPSWTNIPKNSEKITCKFKKGSVIANIYVLESHERYFVMLIVADTSMKDKSINSSEGF